MPQLKVTALLPIRLVLSMLVALLLPQLTIAKTPSNTELLEEVPSPPRIQEGEALEAPDITIRKKGTKTIEEYR